MAKLSITERKKLENLFGMGGGYVLDFTDYYFSLFFSEYGVKIDTERYSDQGTSKAKRMRRHWDLDSNHLVGRVINDLIDYAIENDCLGDNNPTLIEDCRNIATRLLCEELVDELNALPAIDDEPGFERLKRNIYDLLVQNHPEDALDRLHTYCNKVIRAVCRSHDIEYNRTDPLNKLTRKYVCALRDGGHLESEMTSYIMTTSISLTDKFNDVRNNQSHAHDNPILNYEESVLIFKVIIALLQFIQSLEAKIKRR